jgi:hypothetical protein
MNANGHRFTLGYSAVLVPKYKLRARQLGLQFRLATHLMRRVLLQKRVGGKVMMRNGASIPATISFHHASKYQL